MLKGENHVARNKTRCYVTLDDGGNYVTFHELNYSRKDKKGLKQVNLKARL